MSDKISRESKLTATTAILNGYIKTFESKEGNGGSKISLDEVCAGFKQIYQTIEDTLPNAERRVGLG
ncbi:MAG: hypothetical protein KC476_01125 [Cyanobacteria bacterium HKST-UBA06]|nr:hypothetical protein [Cyanobacteria bacterium HKST-UBA05]MCA9799631.1 hypothetical protein [Cyanobacteria bacterium HKST-UBA04]MCA9806532.1 hypothetical protein [Cyanobacteria bacterium HKST-UBA06]MCA9842612.1 hypothetical protein [Cyanobacteria bacterium HKST-UBA03]